MHRFFAVPVICFSLAMALSGGAGAEEFRPRHSDGMSGIPLSHYCNHVPDLSVNRPDAVGTWVKICTVYFGAVSNQPAKTATGSPSQSEKASPAS